MWKQSIVKLKIHVMAKKDETAKSLSNEELIAENEELKKQLQNQKDYAKKLSKQLKETDKPSGPVKSVTF
jgi:hypothetical protein